jgi:Holliday junction resolvase-like predicted endonuclease
MARRRKKSSEAGGLILLLPVLALGGLLMQHPEILLVPFLLAMLLAGLWLWSRSSAWKRLRALKLADVDNMPGHQFEHYVAALLEHQGFRTTVTKGSGDFGVDVIARKGDLKYAVQTKRYNTGVSRSAVSDAVAAKGHYGCNAALVVTTSRFTAGARQFARSTGCVLVDRDTLAQWILALQEPAPAQKCGVAERQRPDRLTAILSDTPPNPPGVGR